MQERPIILSILLTKATQYSISCILSATHTYTARRALHHALQHTLQQTLQHSISSSASCRQHTLQHTATHIAPQTATHTATHTATEHTIFCILLASSFSFFWRRSNSAAISISAAFPRRTPSSASAIYSCVCVSIRE